MKYTELYEEDSFLTNEDEIYVWMNNSFNGFNIDKLTIEPDGLVYDGDLDLRVHIAELKVNFKYIGGYISYMNSAIINLKGSPKYVGDTFYCNHTNITSLKNVPISTSIDLVCSNVKIADPKEYRFALYCEIGNRFYSNYTKINDIINDYKGAENRKHWAHAINLLSKVKL